MAFAKPEDSSSDLKRPPSTPAAKLSRRSTVQAGVAVALSLLLAMFSFAPFPSGGQISLDMLPILVLARLKGWQCGVAAGICYGVLHILQEPLVFNVWQAFCDYPLAYGLLGLAGLPDNFWHLPKTWLDQAAIITGIIGRYLAHVVSGILFIELFLPADQLPGSVTWWSLGYNASFLALPAVSCLLVAPVLLKALRQSKL